MEILSQLIELDSDPELSRAFLGLGLFFFLAALMVIFWWLLSSDDQLGGTEEESSPMADDLVESNDPEPRDFSGIISSQFANEEIDVDDKLGLVYTTNPSEVDDLTEIKGVNDAFGERLNKNGIYQFKQIATWDSQQVAAFEDRLGIEDCVTREEWIEQAKRLSARQNGSGLEYPEEEAEPVVPSEEDYKGFESKYSGEEITIDNKLGVLFVDDIHCEDDLTQISGIGKVLKGKLNGIGVFRFQQIADWNDYNVWCFNKIISFPGRIQRDEWIRQAEALALTSQCSSGGGARVSEDDLAEIIDSEFRGEDVEVRPPFGIVYKSAPLEIDNLQTICGVGPVLEKKLHDFGVYRFKQIANWPDAAIDEFQEQLSFPDRIRRDNWVAQCEDFIESAVTA